MTRPLPIDSLADAVLAGERRALAKAITLVESTRVDHQEAAQRLLERLLPATGRAHRVGISGVPGVGKSTFIEAFGIHLVGREIDEPRRQLHEHTLEAQQLAVFGVGDDAFPRLK